MISFAKKFLSIALAAVLLLSVFPMAASAEVFNVTIHVDGSAYVVPTTEDGKLDKSNEEYKKADAAAGALANKGTRGAHVGWAFKASKEPCILSTYVFDTNDYNLIPRYEEVACQHKHTSEHITKDASCTATGLKDVVCDDCGVTLAHDVVIDKLAHTYDVVTEESTCKTQGRRYKQCTVCEYIDPDSVEILPLSTKHAWGEWETVKPATATKEGVKQRTCEVCGKTETDVIPVTDDPIVSYKITFDENKPSEFKAGTKNTYEIKDGQRIATLFEGDALPQATCNLHVFKGWYLCNEDGSVTNVNITNETVFDFGRHVTLKAKWGREARVQLKIYRNGNTSTPYAEYPVYGYEVGDTLYTKDIKIGDWYKNGGKPFDFDGWYDRHGWTLFKAKDNPKPASAIEIGDLNADTVLFGMITDNNAPASNKTPDHTNPKTGDESMIIATTAVMLVSAGALAVFFMDRKRRNG